MPHGSVRCLLALVVLLFFLLAPVAPAPPPVALPPHCKDEEMICFVSKECVSPGESAKIDSTSNDGKYCDAHMEIRPYNTKKALIRLKSKHSSIKIAFKEPTETVLFGCESEGAGKDMKVQSTADSTGVKQFLYGGKWKVSGGILECEFLYEDDSSDDSPSPLFDSSKTFAIQYGSDQIIPGSGPGQISTALKPFMKCDMDWLENKFEPHEKYLYADADRKFKDVTCPAGQELVYEDEQKPKVAAGGISCNKIANPALGEHPYRYEIFKEENDASPLTVTHDAPAKVACQSIACKQCSKTAPPCPGGSPGCTAPALATDADCDFLRCASGIVAVNGGAPTLGELACKKHEIPASDGAEGRTEAKTEARWMLGGTVVTSVECKDAVSCQDVNPLMGDAEAGIDLTKPTLTCSEQRKIRIDGGDNQTDTIQCDAKTGGWYYEVGGVKTAVAKGATLSCEVVAATDTEAVAGASMGMTEYVAMGAGGLVIIAVVALIVFCFIIKPKRKRDAAKKIKTISSNNTTGDSKSAAENLKTAIPVGIPPAAPPTTSPDLANHPFTPAPDLVEKTVIANTPSIESKQGQTLNTAVGNTATTDPTDKLPSMIEGAVQATVRHPGDVKHIPGETELKKAKRNENGEIIDAEDMSEPQSIKIGKDGNVLPPKKKNKHTKVPPLPDDEDKSKSEADGTKKAAAPPAEVGPKPQVFPLNEKEEKIRRGATVKMAEYPTLAEIESDWEDKPGNEKKEKTKGKTVPSAVTPEVPPATERTQNNNTRNTTDNKNDPELENLVTQLDTTVEQKEAEMRRKKK